MDNEHSTNSATPINKKHKCSTEHNILVTLFGRNEVPCVRIWGWTNTIALEFPTLKTNLAMRKVLEESGTILASLEVYKEASQSLRALTYTAEYFYQLLRSPVCVQVIAKKAVDIIAKRDNSRNTNQNPTYRFNNSVNSELHTALLIGNIVVADWTGACAITLFNEATEIIHKEVEIGDCMLISRASYRSPPRTFNAGNPFNKGLLNVEIKIDKYQVRHVTLIPYRSHSQFKLIQINLFGPDDRLWFPSEILQDDPNGFEKNIIKTEAKKPYIQQLKLKKKYFDVLGFVKFVGMLERCEIGEKKFNCFHEKESSEPDLSKPYHTMVQQYQAYRWIELIDPSCREPLLVKVLITRNNMGMQDEFFPGTLMVITHCQTPLVNFLSPHITTTIFTTIYLNDDAFKVYFKLMPQRYIKSIEIPFAASATRMLFQNNNIKWCAGGSGHPTIRSSDELVEHFRKNTFRGHNEKKQLTFSRRESRVLFFRGTIEDVQKLTEYDTISTGISTGPQKSVPASAFSKAMNYGDSIVYKNSFSANNWLCHRRKLPIISVPSLTEKEKTKSLIQTWKLQSEKYCRGLVFPSNDSFDLDAEQQPLQGCEMERNSSYYRVVIRDCEFNRFYDTAWRTFTEQEMGKKLSAAKGKVVIGLIDVQNIEAEWGLEVNLRDFVIENTSVTKK